MVIILSGATHTGKTALAQKLLKKYNISVLSIDHLKMGLIRSGQTPLTPYDDEELTPYLWSIVKEIIKTVIENDQSLIVEGCYIPFDWQKDFEKDYLREIKFYCLVMTENYIKRYFEDIINYENVAEKRLGDGVNEEELIKENEYCLRQCEKYNLNFILIDENYDIEVKI